MKSVSMPDLSALPDAAHTRTSRGMFATDEAVAGRAAEPAAPRAP